MQAEITFVFLLSEMASADLRKLLVCSGCLNTYTDPVIINCGHSFCRVCIDRVLDKQMESGGYSCPECGEKFQERPALHNNIILHDIVENFHCDQPGQLESAITCTYCIHASVPAVKCCLLCEASLCGNHLKVHSKSQEHVLSDPNTSPEDRKSSLHKKIMEYSCTENSESIHVSCCLIAIHKGDQVASLNEISEKTKKLRSIQQKFMAKKEEIEKRVQSLYYHQRKVEQKVDNEIKKVINLFTDFRRQLEDLEKTVLSEISRQKNQHSLLISDLIQQLETKKDELSRRMHQIEEQCNTTDPLRVPLESDISDLYDTGDGDTKDIKTYEEQLQTDGDLDLTHIRHILRTGLSDIITRLNGGIYVQEALDILLDVNSATQNLHVSDDMKTATLMGNQNRPETPETFQFYPQVISRGTFNSGRHYWEVDVRGSHYWKIGVCYPSIQRKGGQRGSEGLSGNQEIGYNDKSWVMERWNMEYFMIHDHRRFQLHDNITGDKIRVLLDYEAGQISFYDLGDQIRHLHSYTAIFTEPLHAALLIWDDFGFLTIGGGDQH
ncbi:E3 ubiquitin-protein ligase TRIM39-like isoform X1 [Pyxicephalus adspersus]|uniref:E3 ubiquitin-protein ligase TRIM39-like isoform X1 n=1 Tax=Pyxicephalus adspersus TaxID=30357 RepID=UPI003B5CF608